MAGLSVSFEIVSGNYRALHAQFRIQDAINARLEEISFRKGIATGASALLFLTGLGVVTAELASQGNPANGALGGQADGVPPAVTTHSGSASAPGSAVPSHSPRRPHAQPRAASRPSPHPATVSTTSAPAVSAIPPTGSQPGNGPRHQGGRDWDGWHRGELGWDGWGPGGGDPWHGGHHW